MGTYTTWTKIREEAGCLPNEVRDPIKLWGVPDGTKTVFEVPTGYIIDRDGDEVTDKDDVTVYVDGVSVTVSSIDDTTGEITLAAAPDSGDDLTVTYWNSPIKDSEIAAYLVQNIALVEERSRTKVSSTAYTEYWDGNGSNKEFSFEHIPVVSISTITVDENTSYTEGTDYWLYPSPTKARFIKFLNPPINNNQNIIIAYNYGEASEILKKLVEKLTVRDILMNLVSRSSVPKTGYSGQTKEMVFYPESKHTLLLRRVNEELPMLWNAVGGSIRAGVI